MALNDAQFTLGGINLGSTDIVSPVIASPESLRNAPVEAAAAYQRGMQAFEQGHDMRIKMDEAARRQRLQRNLDAKLPRDATALDLQILEAYNQEVGGDAPMYTAADGRQVYDMAAIRNLMSNKRALQFEAEGGFGRDKLTTFQEAAMGALTKGGYLAAAFDPQTGQLKDDEGMFEALRQMPSVDPTNAQKIQDNIMRLESSLIDIDRARQAVSPETVGPLRGNWAAQKWNFVASAFGGDTATKRFQSQRDLEMFINNQALQQVQYMKGALSDKDIQFLLKSVRGMTDTPEAWNEYLNLRETMTKRAMENLRQGLYFPEGSDTPISPQTGQPAAPAPATTTAGTVPTVAPSMPGGIDYSIYDRQPARVQNLPNSTLLRGKRVRDSRTGALGIDIGGQIIRVSDDTYKWVQQEQMKQRSAATPMSAPLPVAPTGNLQNVRPGVMG